MASGYGLILADSLVLLRGYEDVVEKLEEDLKDAQEREAKQARRAKTELAVAWKRLQLACLSTELAVAWKR